MKNIFKIILFFFLFQIASLQAQLPDGFYDEIVTNNFDQHVGIVFDETGRGFTWRRSGEVFMLDTNGVLLPNPIIDISEEVASWWDMGMLGFALDPKFLENGKVYLFYVMDRHHLLYFGTPEYDPNKTITDEATIGRITRYTLDKSNDFKTVVPNSRKILIGEKKENGFPLLFKTHGTGSLAFGTDGTLFASCGDTSHPDWEDTGGSFQTYHAQSIADGMMREAENVGAYRSQLINSLGGKIIRIDPETGEGLPSNPFYDFSNPNSAQSKVWAMGLRNPYRFLVKPNTGSHFPNDGKPGELYIGDVGNNYWEELNISINGGENFGWPIYEGFEYKPNYTTRNTKNKDAKNPLYNINGCEEEFFLFNDLFALPNSQKDVLFKNPCDTSQLIPADIKTHLHAQPTMAYRNKDDNFFPEVFFPDFDMDGTAIAYSIEDMGGLPFEGISSIGGFFYQGNSFPEEYQEKYFHIDYHGWIRIIEFDAENEVENIELFNSSALNIVALSENPNDGCLYYIDYKNRRLHKICYGGTPAPVVVVEADKYYGPSPLVIQFDASNSFSPSNSPLIYYWEFGDGITSNETKPTHTFITANNSPKSYEVKLTVTDTTGQSKKAELIISINNTPPKVTITSLPDTSFYSLDRTTLMQLRGKAIDNEHGESELVYEWRTFLHHDEHEHTDLIDEAKESRFFLSPLGCNDAVYWYRVELKVTDAAGLSSVDTSQIFPYCENDLFNLIYFNAEKNNKTVQLKWETEFEKNITYYEIERGETIFDFKTLARINPNNLLEYKHTDYYPIIGTNFYRLKIWNDENIFSYTAPVMVDFSVEGKDILLYPNPAKDLISLSVKNIIDEKINFRLYNLNGALVLKKTWWADLDNYFNEQIIVSELAQGIYFYEIENGDKNKIKTGAIILE